MPLRSTTYVILVGLVCLSSCTVDPSRPSTPTTSGGASSGTSATASNTHTSSDSSVNIAPAATANDLTIRISPTDNGYPSVSERRFTGADDRKYLGNPNSVSDADRIAFYERNHETGTVEDFFKFTFINTGASALRITKMVPDVLDRQLPIDATYKASLGGAGTDEVNIVELDLDQRFPSLTQDGAPYFPSHSMLIGSKESLDLTVHVSAHSSYCRYRFKVEFSNQDGSLFSANINSLGSSEDSFSLSALLPVTDYKDVWLPSDDGQGWHLASPAEVKAYSEIQ